MKMAHHVEIDKLLWKLKKIRKKNGEKNQKEIFSEKIELAFEMEKLNSRGAHIYWGEVIIIEGILTLGSHNTLVNSNWESF